MLTLIILVKRFADLQVNEDMALVAGGDAGVCASVAVLGSVREKAPAALDPQQGVLVHVHAGL